MKMKQLIKATIEDVIVEPSKIQPIIVNFQNGELKDEEAQKMSSGLFYDQKNQKTLLALSNGQIVYKGYKPDTQNELTRTMLVLHNKKTGKVRLVQAERWQVSPVLEKPQVVDSNAASDDKITVLNRHFGSKKVKRRTEQYERLKLNVDSVKEQLEQSVSNVEIDRLDLSTQLEENDLVGNASLPECNRNATRVNDVYNINDIIPRSKLELLYETATKVLNGEVEGKSQFFTKTIRHLQSDPDNTEKAALLLYIQAVCTWLNMPIKDAKKRGIEICPASQEVNSHIIHTYSISSAQGRTRPNSMRDKGVIHCIILALTIWNYTLNLESFATIMINRSIGLKKLKDLAKIIGALPNKDDKNTITLKVPLPAPVSIVRKGKQKKSDK